MIVKVSKILGLRNLLMPVAGTAEPVEKEDPRVTIIEGNYQQDQRSANGDIWSMLKISQEVIQRDPNKDDHSDCERIVIYEYGALIEACT